MDAFLHRFFVFPYCGFSALSLLLYAILILYHLSPLLLVFMFFCHLFLSLYHYILVTCSYHLVLIIYPFKLLSSLLSFNTFFIVFNTRSEYLPLPKKRCAYFSFTFTLFICFSACLLFFSLLLLLWISNKTNWRIAQNITSKNKTYYHPSKTTFLNVTNSFRNISYSYNLYFRFVFYHFNR